MLWKYLKSYEPKVHCTPHKLNVSELTALPISLAKYLGTPAYILFFYFKINAYLHLLCINDHYYYYDHYNTIEAIENLIVTDANY